MKMNVKLGVPTEDLLKHPTACFRLSRSLTRISDALAFGEFYIKEPILKNKTPFIVPRELEHLSASIYTSGRSAEELASLVEDENLKKTIKAYASSAARLNSVIRERLKERKQALEKKNGKKKAAVPELFSMEVIKKNIERLRKKVREITANVEDLCTVRAPSAPQVSMKGIRPRVGMAGSTPKKRPIYPRYFVASMGRTRR